MVIELEIFQMTLEEHAKAIAEEANECCYRGDGFEKEMYTFALKHLTEACQEAINDYLSEMES